ncbi:MAG TPA: endonuclease/exonuclease/phosphatase family protein [Candidatus Hydrogenedentes bacterium]|nr:endonuclease/exonuclease/phosphatase family protein [Candidatus Hydrogenedentota bacterium]
MSTWKSTVARVLLKSLTVPFAFLIVLVLIVLFAAVFINPQIQAEQNLARSSLLLAPPPPLREPLTLKIVTYNVADAYLFTGNREERMRAIAAKLVELDADLVGLQESFVQADRNILLSVLAGSKLHHHMLFPGATVGNGLLILSAFPIQEAFFHRYEHSNPWYKLWQGDWWAGKGVGLARVMLPNGAIIDFYNTHAQAGRGDPGNAAVRSGQMKELTDFIKESRLPGGLAFVVGDFNTRRGNMDLEYAVEHAGMQETMTLDSGIDQIFALNTPHYVHETLETIRIDGTTQGSRPEFFLSRAPSPSELWNAWHGKPGMTALSDHSGFMSTIRITPNAS